MSFRLRISIVFTLLVGLILAFFGSYLYAESESIRAQEFYERLTERANVAEHFLRDVDSLSVLETERFATALQEVLPNEAVAILSPAGEVIYTRARPMPTIPANWLVQARKRGELRVGQGERQFVVRVSAVHGIDGPMLLVASAIDVEGRSSLLGLRRSLFLGSFAALLLTALIAWGYATWTLAPVRLLIRTANEIREPSQRIPLPDQGRMDELGGLASTFNALLARIEDAFKVQRSFIASASHELRTPLTVVRGELHHALQLVEGNEPLRAKLNAIGSQALLMQDLLAQLLWLAKIQGPLELIASEVVRMDEVAERAMERCRGRYPERTVRFAMETDEEGHEPLVRGNTVLLTAALYNLLTNAAKYGGDGPIILRLMTVGSTEVAVSVIDQGPGMSEDVLARVREMFYRASDTAFAEGHGIGLALVERIAKVHSGRLEMDTGPGKGTTVSLVLPAVRRPDH